MSTLAGAGTVIRFALRRERVRAPIYLLVMFALLASTAAQSESLYATQAQRDEYAATVTGNPGLIALVGPAYRLTTVGGDTAWQWGGIGAIVAALMSMFVVARHTRGDEQSGRSELLRASVLGRRASAAAALAVVTAVNVLLAAVVALSLTALGQPAAGSIALGASLGGAGLLFAGVAIVAMQVAQSTGGASAIVGAVLGGSYLLRAAGDVGDGTLSWLSPIGWAQSMRPFADERWWPLLLLLGGGAALSAAALALLDRRDDGAGLIAPRPGPARASAALTHPLGIATRLLRGALIGWATGLFLAGVSVGLTGQDVERLLGDSAEVDKLYNQAGGSLVDNYLAVSLSSMALIGTAFALQAVLRMRSEETAGRAEPLLAIALVGLAPRATAAAWGALGACFLVLYLGPLLSLPDWVMDLSPFTHVPLLPAAAFDAVPLLALTAIAAALAAVGLAGLRRRDIPVT